MTLQEMVEMNDRVDRLKQSPYDVARDFLLKKGFLQGSLKENHNHSNIWQYFISQKDYLAKLLKEHIVLTLVALSFGVLLSLPLGILMTRYNLLKKMIFLT